MVGVAEVVQSDSGGQASSVVVHADAQDIALHTCEYDEVGGLSVAVRVLHRLGGDGEQLTRDNLGNVRYRCVVEKPEGGGESVPPGEVIRSGTEFAYDVHASVESGLAAQVGEELAGLGGGPAGGTGDQFGLVPDGERVHAVGGAGQAVGSEGQAVQGLGDRVVHLSGEAGALALDGLVDGEAGSGLGEGLTGRPEAEEEIAQGDAYGTRDHAETGQQERRGIGGLQLRIGSVHPEDDDDLECGEDRRTAPAVDESGKQGVQTLT